jgi:adenine deaminase
MAVKTSKPWPENDAYHELMIQTGQLIIVARAERFDDQRLALLIDFAKRNKAKIVLGHDQSYTTGVVNRQLAAYATDQAANDYGAYGPEDLVRLLRSGLIRHAIAVMARCNLLHFTACTTEHKTDASTFVVCDDLRRLDEVWQTNLATESALDQPRFQDRIARRSFRSAVGL